MYNVLDHGDLFEKEAADFIRNKFPFYERVWQVYIGNTGNASIASLPAYPDEKKRISFSEHSYTVLESCFMIQSILASDAFMTEINSFNTYFEFNKALICFFACLGRIRDNIIKAAEDLRLNTDEISENLKEFYEARNIIIHGKRIPIVLDEDGLVKMPILKTGKINGNAWSDKEYGWADISHLPTQYADDRCEQYFSDLLVHINNIYAQFFDTINAELKSIPTSLVFLRDCSSSLVEKREHLEVSGSTYAGGG